VNALGLPQIDLVGFTLSQRIPNAQFILYSDSGHGALFQYPELFVAHTKVFLDA
jgi:pimeloyl-ACP methyl ester carboxylesterase